MPVLALAAKQFVGSKEFKALKEKGVALLGSITGCKVKPKGSPHSEVYRKAPKLFYTYGEGIPGTREFKPSHRTNGGLFDPITGAWVLDLESVFPRAERKQVEANFRKPCETTTGDVAFYTEVKPSSEARGFVKLSDGNIYDAKVYGVDGGTSTNPVSVNVPPIGAPGSDGGAVTRRTLSPASGGVPALAGVGLLGYLLLRR